MSRTPEMIRGGRHPAGPRATGADLHPQRRLLAVPAGRGDEPWLPRRALGPLGIEPRQFAMLRHISFEEGRSQQALGEVLRISPSRMVALLDDLQDRGLLERRANPDDRRARALYLTGAGRSLLSEAGRRAEAHEARVCAGLKTPEERDPPGVVERIHRPI